MILLSQLAPSDHLLGMKSKRPTISLADSVVHMGVHWGTKVHKLVSTFIAILMPKSQEHG